VSNDQWDLQVRLQRERERDDKVLLPAHVVPIKYHLTIRPNLNTFTFNGTETVEVRLHTFVSPRESLLAHGGPFQVVIAESSDSVTLHAYQLNITQAAMRWEGVAEPPTLALCYTL
jgi:hypothetical protein